ncbi:MAG: hypothetical protein ACYDCC_15675 [Actinomycetota bacterium]
MRTRWSNNYKIRHAQWIISVREQECQAGTVFFKSMDYHTDMDFASKMNVALDLFDAAIEIERQNLRRKHPAESDEVIEARVRDWVRTRPGAEFGDAPGRIRRLDEQS